MMHSIFRNHLLHAHLFCVYWIFAGSAFGLERNVSLDIIGSVRIPDPYRVEAPSEALPGFRVFYVTRGEDRIMGIYVGRNPDLSGVLFSPPRQKGGCLVSRSVTHRDNLSRLDVLIDTQTDDSRRFIHIWSAFIDNKEYVTMNQIVDSIVIPEPLNCNLGRPD